MKLKLFGNILDSVTSLWEGSQNRKAQKQAAQNSVSWRVADAKRAGIHPLAAMGISPSQMQPVYSDTKFSEAGKAIDERNTTALEKKQIAEQINGLKLDNQHKEVELALKQKELQQLLSSPDAPTLDSSGVIQNNSNRPTPNSHIPGVQFNPKEITMMRTHGITAGPPDAAISQSVTPYGTVIDRPEKELMEYVSENPLGMIQYIGGQLTHKAIGNLLYVFGNNKSLQRTKRAWLKTKPEDTKKAVYKWSMFRAAWVAVPRNQVKKGLFIEVPPGAKPIKNVVDKAPRFFDGKLSGPRMKKSHRSLKSTLN